MEWNVAEGDGLSTRHQAFSYVGSSAYLPAIGHGHRRMMMEKPKPKFIALVYENGDADVFIGARAAYESWVGQIDRDGVQVWIAGVWQVLIPRDDAMSLDDKLTALLNMLRLGIAELDGIEGSLDKVRITKTTRIEYYE